MARDRSPLTPGRHVLAAMAPFVLAAGLALLFDVVREIPASYTCGESAPPDHDDVIAAYRSGALALHLLTIGAALGALALLSAGRGRGPLGIGWPTLVAMVAMVAAAVVVLVPIDKAALVVFLPLVMVVIGIVIAAGLFGAQVTAALAALLLLGAAAWARRAVVRGRTLALRAALWTLVVLTGAHLLLVYFQGDPPTFC